MNTSFEQRLRTDLREAAVSIASSPPRFDASKQPRRRHFIAIGAAGVVLVGGGVAIAGRLIPEDVQRTNDQMTEVGVCGSVLSDRAQMVATTPRTDGNQLELWVSPTSTGNSATNLRIVEPDGTWLGGGGGCGWDDPSSFAAAATETAEGQTDGLVDIYGRTDPGASAARVTFQSGAVVTVAVQTDGYFVYSLSDDVNKYQMANLIEPID